MCGQEIVRGASEERCVARDLSGLCPGGGAKAAEVRLPSSQGKSDMCSARRRKL